MKEHRIPLAGSWRSVGELYTEITNPADGRVVSRVPALERQDVDAAVSAAQEALRTSDWAWDGRLRADVLLQWADRLADRVDEIAERLVLENGKVRREARFEVANQIQVIRYNAGLARSLAGRSHSLGRHVAGLVTVEPMGVVAVISPWNWPIALLTRDLAPALAAGNAALCKPASQTAGATADFLATLAEVGDLPPGILSVVTGSGSRVGQAMVEHPGINMIAFTGDGSTGQRILRDAAPTFKKVVLELGGKSPFVICADADLDKAAGELASAIFTTTSGQICTAPSRALVEASCFEEIAERLCSIVANIKLGDGLNENSTMGPLTTREQYDKVVRHIREAKQNCRLLAGGDIPEAASVNDGLFVGPTIFTDIPPGAPLLHEEIFGPVLTLQSFSTDEEAVALANSTSFGLSAAVFCRDLNRTMRLSREIRAGTVWVNTYNRFYPETEVGGYGDSGIGRMAGESGLREFTQTKHINLDFTPGTIRVGRVG
ncbi:MAG: aldehyde dehydrogenase family protein [Haliea sp.]|uniref:aldehyde dehydrogenase family protein n=1 Tax=Haliea sp. TaxID=1932666 RepID=UPI0032EBDA15